VISSQPTFSSLQLAKSKSATLASQEVCPKLLAKGSTRKFAEIKRLLRAAEKEMHGRLKKAFKRTLLNNCWKTDREEKNKNDICLCMLVQDGTEPLKSV